MVSIYVRGLSSRKVVYVYGIYPFATSFVMARSEINVPLACVHK